MQQLEIGPEVPVHDFWTHLARQARQWLDSQGLSVKDAMVLLPFAQHLAPARRAWAAQGGWLPRLETTHSLASALRPNILPQALQISLDPAIDALSAAQLLQGQSWAQALRRTDPRAHALALNRLVEVAHLLLRCSHACAPEQRADYWDRAREALQGQGPGGMERALTLVALEWAASDARSPATDRLFELRPSAWVLLQAGGPDDLALAVLAHAQTLGVPTLLLQADFELESLSPCALQHSQPEVALCDDFEDLAQSTAAAIIAHVNAERTPVALAALDRVLVRRVRAMLDAAGVGVADETGWTLATAPEAAAVMDLLRASGPQASMDDLLSLLKSLLCGRIRDLAGAQALPQMELRCRRERWREPRALDAASWAGEPARLWGLCRHALLPLSQGPRRQSLSDWLQALGEVLDRLGAREPLEAQPAGAQLLDALWLRRQPWPGSAHEAAMSAADLSHGDFLAWVGATLESAQFMPTSQLQPQVMVTPLARCMLRPFGAVVLPGADAQTLGSVSPPPALLGDGLALALGLPGVQQKRQALGAAFAQLLRVPVLTLLRSRAQGAEPLAPSPLLERLHMAWRRAGRGALPVWADPRRDLALPAKPIARAEVSLPGVLPEALSASAIESLRNCPYQFFARVLMGLGEADELEGEIEKRDYGDWLHGVLHRFHELRRPSAKADSPAEKSGAPGADGPLESPADLLLWIGEQERERLGLSADEFLPYAASFQHFVPRYLTWLHAQEDAGWHYQQGEWQVGLTPFDAASTPLSSLRLHGRIDRVDGLGVMGGEPLAQPLRLIDYKTGSLVGLKEKARQGAEDTQLAVYAALCGAGQAEAGAMEAMYLSLDDRDAPTVVSHPDVVQSAQRLLAGLASDLQAMQDGQALPALGEGMACSYCAVRGLCRRDDWGP